MPGQYNLTVTCVDNTGYYYRYPANPGDASFGGHLESKTISFWVGGLPNALDVTVLDANDMPLHGAKVSFATASGTTDANGNVTLSAFAGTFTLRVHWQDILVYENDSVSITGDTQLTVNADVYSPTIRILDDANDAVNNAVIFVQHPNGTLYQSTWKTNSAGQFQLPQIPAGDLGMTVYWRGVKVFTGEVAISSNGPISINVNIFIIDIVVKDDAGAGLELAQVVITNSTTGIVTDSKLTDLTGNLTTRLPIGTYDFDVYWKNVLVDDDETGHGVSSSHSLELTADVFYLTVKVKGSDGSGLDKATVFVYSGWSAIASGITPSSGELAFRLPQGDYTVNMTFTTTYYMSGIDISDTQQVTLDQDKTVTFDLADYPLPIYKTAMFLVIVLIIILLVLIIIIAAKR